MKSCEVDAIEALRDGILLYEVNDIAEIIYEVIDPYAYIVFGAAVDEKMGDRLKVVLIFGV